MKYLGIMALILMVFGCAQEEAPVGISSEDFAV